MSTLLRVAELNAAYAATIDTDKLESWPDFFVEDCLYKITSADNHKRGHSAGVVYADSRACYRTGLPRCELQISTSVRVTATLLASP
jgi:3-phenylpropionate/cinnamic acid dioxygenase small subunit